MFIMGGNSFKIRQEGFEITRGIAEIGLGNPRSPYIQVKNAVHIRVGKGNWGRKGLTGKFGGGKNFVWGRSKNIPSRGRGRQSLKEIKG